MKAVRKTRVFLSYSRKDQDIAVALQRKLVHHEIDVFRDLDDTGAGESWWSRLQSLIISADLLLVLLSDNAAQSEVCASEIAFARENAKRIVPIIISNLNWNLVAAEIRELHCLGYYGQSEAEFSAVEAAIKVDLPWIREATRLAELARDWAANNRRDSDILRGDSLAKAESWLNLRPADSEVSEAVEEFICSSRSKFDRETLKAQRMIERTLVSQSLFLVDLARQQVDAKDFAPAVALVLEALPTDKALQSRPVVPGAEMILFHALSNMREVRTPVEQQTPVNHIAANGFNHEVATCSVDGRVRLWSATSGTLQAEWALTSEPVQCAMLTGDRILVGTADGDLLLLERSAHEPSARETFPGKVEGIHQLQGTSRVAVSGKHGIALLDIATDSINLGAFFPILDGSDQFSWIIDLQWSPGGDLVAVSISNGSFRLLRIKDLNHFEEVPFNQASYLRKKPMRFELRAPGDLSRPSCDFDPSTPLLLTTHPGGIVRTWSAENGSLQDETVLTDVPIVDIHVLPDGGLLLALSGGDALTNNSSYGDTLLIGRSDGQTVKRLTGTVPPNWRLRHCVSRSGDEIITVKSVDGAPRIRKDGLGQVYIWSTKAATPIAEWKAHTMPIQAISFAGPQSSHILTTSLGLTDSNDPLRIWRTNLPPSTTARLTWSEEGDVSTGFASDGLHIVGAQEGGQLMGLALAANNSDPPIEIEERCRDWRMVETRVLSLSVDGKLLAFDLSTSRLLWSIDLTDARWRLLDIQADSGIIALAHESGAVEIRELRNVTVSYRLPSLSGDPRLWRLTSGGRGYVAVYDNGQIDIADELDTKLRSFSIGHRISKALLTPDERTLLTTSAEFAEEASDLVQCWDVSTLSHVGSVGMSEDGFATENTEDGLWAFHSGHLEGRPAVFRGPTFGVTALAVSPDSREVAIASGRIFGDKYRSVAIWDLDSRSIRLVMAGITSRVRHIAWSPDGDRLLLGHEQGSLSIADARSGQIISSFGAFQNGRSNSAIGQFSPDGRLVLVHSRTATRALCIAPPPTLGVLIADAKSQLPRQLKQGLREKFHLGLLDE